MLQSNLREAIKKISLQFICRTIVVLFVFQGSFHASVSAQGNLLVMPKRVVFEGNKRSEDLNLSNIGQDTATYVISFIHIRMKDDGTFETINKPDSGQQFAEKYLRFFPRTVTLAPKESQTIKVQLIKTGELTAGEYRSHLYFRAVPKTVAKGEVPEKKDSGIQIKIVPVLGLSIPTIIRAGEPDVQVKLEAMKLEVAGDTAHHLKVIFSRTGSMSVYGDIIVDHIAPNGKVTQVSFVKGLAIYTPNKQRRFDLLLDKTKQVDYRSGKLHVVYADKIAGKQVVLLEGDLPLNNLASTVSK